MIATSDLGFGDIVATIGTLIACLSFFGAWFNARIATFETRLNSHSDKFVPRHECSARAKQYDFLSERVTVLEESDKEIRERLTFLENGD